MDKIQEIKNSIEDILDKIDEGLIEIETICLTPTELENYENDNIIACENIGNYREVIENTKQNIMRYVGDAICGIS